jgi:hypothetical protein
MKTKTFFSVMLITSFLGCKTPKPIYTKYLIEPINWIELKWIENEINGKQYKKAGISIDFDIKRFKQRLSLQFDTGSQQSFVSAEAFDYLVDKYPELASKIDTLEYDEINSDIVLKGLVVNTSEQEFLLNIYKGESEGSESKTSNNIIRGTLGADFCADKIVIINYPDERIAFESKIPDDWYNTLIDCESTFGKLNIPIEVKNKKNFVLFDTGASFFELVTTPEGYRLFFENMDFAEEIEVPSFGTILKFKGKRTTDNIMVAGKEIKMPYVYYSENPDVIHFIKESELFGVTGNALFLNDVVIIDFANQKFGLRTNPIYKSYRKQ